MGEDAPEVLVAGMNDYLNGYAEAHAQCAYGMLFATLILRELDAHDDGYLDALAEYASVEVRIAGLFSDLTWVFMWEKPA